MKKHETTVCDMEVGTVAGVFLQEIQLKIRLNWHKSCYFPNSKLI